jgi:hypothetical protein
MSTAALDAKKRWAVAGAGAGFAALVVLGLAGFTRVTPPAASKPAELAPVVMIAQANDEAMRGETMISNLAPLFLPTPYNARLPDLPLRGALRPFLDSDPVKLTHPDSAPNFTANLPPVATLNGKSLPSAAPLDAIATDASISVAHGFGRADPTVVPLPARGGIVEVVAVATAERIRPLPLAVEARPPGDRPWQPLEFSAVVNAAGLVGALELTTSSRVEAVDNYFKNYLVQQLRIGDRLPPGFYRITVGP